MRTPRPLQRLLGAAQPSQRSHASRRRTRQLRRRTLHLEALEPRQVLTALFDVQVEHVPTYCHEVDNARALIQQIPGTTLDELFLISTAPGFAARPFPDQSNFTGCDFGPGHEGEGKVVLREFALADGGVLQLWNDPNFWQPPMTVQFGEESVVDVTQATLYREIGENDVRQIFVITSDGWTRSIPLPGSNGIDWKFNASTVIGPIESVILESGETRPLAALSQLTFDDQAQSFHLQYHAGGSAEIAIVESNSVYTMLRVGMDYESDIRAVVASMYNQGGDNTSDLSTWAAHDWAGNLHVGHFLDLDRLEGVDALALFKSEQTDHNTNGADLTVTTSPVPLLAGVRVYEMEQTSGAGIINARGRASGDVPQNLHQTKWLVDGAVTFQDQVDRPGFYSYYLEYSREALDSVQPLVSLHTGEQPLGTFLASSSRQPETGDWGQAWGYFHGHVLGVANHAAGQDILYTLSVANPGGGDPGIEADTLTRIYLGEDVGDLAPPLAWLTLDGGAAETAARDVLVELETRFGALPAAWSVNTLEPAVFSSPGPIGPSSLVTLPAWVGKNWVNVRVADAAGNTFTRSAAIIYNPPPGCPARLAQDVNGDGLVTPLDVLIVINQLNFAGPTIVPPGVRDPRDVSGDNRLTALDVLQAINWINSRPVAAAPAEGEAVAHAASGSSLQRTPSSPERPRPQTECDLLVGQQFWEDFLLLELFEQEAARH